MGVGTPSAVDATPVSVAASGIAGSATDLAAALATMDSSEMASAAVASSVPASGAAASDSALALALALALGGAPGVPSGAGRLIHIGTGAARTGRVTRGGDTTLLHPTFIGTTGTTARIRIRTM